MSISVDQTKSSQKTKTSVEAVADHLLSAEESAIKSSNISFAICTVLYCTVPYCTVLYCTVTVVQVVLMRSNPEVTNNHLIVCLGEDTPPVRAQ